MKRSILLALLIIINFYTDAQVIVGIKLSPNLTIGGVKDNDDTPSGVNYVADGFTQKEENIRGIGAGINFDFPINDNMYFGTGAWFTEKKIKIRNTDGYYSGVSQYNTLNMQIPALLKYRTGEVFTKKLNLVFSAGPIVDLKMAEALKGGDGAHYWNLAKNKSYIDPSRGHNGNNKKMALFSPFNMGLYISAGAEYQLIDKLKVYAGFSVNNNFLNMVNPALKFDDTAKTPVRKDVRFSSTIISFDLGVSLSGKK